MTLNFNGRFVFSITLLLIFFTDLAILIDIPIIRQIFGFLFLMLLPGLLILQILKLNKLEFVEKLILSVGLSISFLMFFGLLINNLSISLGYLTPLSVVSLLISFNIAFIVLAAMGHKVNKKTSFSPSNLNLTSSEKAFLVIPITFPALSIFGMHVMNTVDNNIILMFLLFLIPAYVAFVCIFNQEFPKRLYPVVIFLISISLLLITMLRFPHIYGHDVHTEYGIFFQTTLDNLHWSVSGSSTLDACLCISILPSIFQSILNVHAQEYLFKGVYVSICSFSPLAVYVISKKYIDESYAFLGSFYFCLQLTFLKVAGSPRTNVAIFFLALAVMVFFNDKTDPLKRKILFIIFTLSVIISHYSTAYIFFFILLFSWFAMEIFSRRHTFEKTSKTSEHTPDAYKEWGSMSSKSKPSSISLTIVLLFFAFIFFWYSQVTDTAFNSGVGYIKNTLINLNNLFCEELRGEEFYQLAGQRLTHPILSKIYLAVTWGGFILVGIGVLTMLKRYKEMIAISTAKLKKPDFLKTKFEMEYLTMVLACVGILVIMVALPHVSKGYEPQRLYSLVLIILSSCFVIGSITLSNYLKLRPYLLMLLILIPLFTFTTGAMYQVFGIPYSPTLCSKGPEYDREYIHDSESYAAKWLMVNGKKNYNRHYTTNTYGKRGLISQGKISPNLIDHISFSKHRKISGYIYLHYNSVVNGKLVVKHIEYNMSEYSDMFIGHSKIYDGGGSEIWG